MKATETILAVCLLGVAGLIIARNGIWHPATASEPTVVAVNSKPAADPDNASHMALLKRYSKPGPSYVAPGSEDPGAADSTDTADQAAIPPYPASPVPQETNQNPPATTNSTGGTSATPRVLAPNPNDLTQPNDDQSQGGGGSAATPPVPYDDYTRALTASQLADPWNASDQQLLDGMMGMLNTDQQNLFQNMWTTMSPDEQEQWLYELRQMLQP